MKLSMLNLSAKFGLYQAHMTDLCQYTVMIDCTSTTKDTEHFLVSFKC